MNNQRGWYPKPKSVFDPRMNINQREYLTIQLLKRLGISAEDCRKVYDIGTARGVLYVDETTKTVKRVDNEPEFKPLLDQFRADKGRETTPYLIIKRYDKSTKKNVFFAYFYTDRELINFEKWFWSNQKNINEDKEIPLKLDVPKFVLYDEDLSIIEDKFQVEEEEEDTDADEENS